VFSHSTKLLDKSPPSWDAISHDIYRCDAVLPSSWRCTKKVVALVLHVDTLAGDRIYLYRLAIRSGYPLMSRDEDPMRAFRGSMRRMLFLIGLLVLVPSLGLFFYATWPIGRTILLSDVSPAACTPPPGWVAYIARGTDTVYDLAARTNTTIEQIQKVNCLVDASLIYDGQVLFLPSGAIVPSTTPIPPPPTPIPSALPTPTLPPTLSQSPVPPVLEARILEVEFPPRLRLGDTDTIRLALRPKTTAPGTTTIEVTIEGVGHVATPQSVSIPAPYQTHNITGHVQVVQMKGLEITSTKPDIQPVRPGESTEWYWLVEPQQLGEQRVIISFVIEYTPKNPGDVQLQPLSVPLSPLTLTIVTVLGMTAVEARILSGIGVSISTLAGLLALWKQLQELLGRSGGKQVKPKRRGK
jgi:LysM repeat protein